MSNRLRSLVAVSCIIMAGNAAAAELDMRPYLTPSVSYTHTDSDKWGLDDGFGFGIGVGKAVNDNLNLELNSGYSSQSFKTGKGTGSEQNVSLAVDALYFLNRNPEFSPYILAGIGALQGRSTGYDQTHLMGDLGIGAMTWLKDVAVRADVRYRYVDGKMNVTKADDWIANIGLVIPLGPKPVPPAPPAPEPAPAPVAAPAPVPAPAPEVVVVEEPRPAAHTKIVLDGTHFDFDKATLRPTGKEKLDQNVKTLTDYPDINVEIAGYTDSIGSSKYNMKLSERRAMTVKKYMESKGIAASRMTTKGFGEAHPVASNKTKAGRAQNRRVEIEIMN